MCTNFYYRIGNHQLGRVILKTQILVEGSSSPQSWRQTVNIKFFSTHTQIRCNNILYYYYQHYTCTATHTKRNNIIYNIIL